MSKPKRSAAAVKGDRPALIVTSCDTIAIRKGTSFAGRSFASDTPLPAPKAGYEPGCDYGVFVTAGSLRVEKLTKLPARAASLFAGFHFAPGGNATARAGGDNTPAINPCSLWDVNFRPACRDPRGMVFIDALRDPFWCDIYLLGADHVANGTSKFGVAIADGDNPPADPKGGSFRLLDFATAESVMKHHGKAMLSYDEFCAAAFGVTEKTTHDGDPKTTQIDAARTSKYGLMQATGNLWTWGHDGDPDTPRPSIFGGAWWSGGDAGSRQASVASWAGSSHENLGARGRSDHLAPESPPRQRRGNGNRA
jgi:hypothetical protein